MSILTLEDVSYTYEGMRQEVLRGINADFELGRVYAIQGKSGAGKSTLLSLLAGLDLCSRGRILFDGTDMRTLDRDIYRARDIGVVFQSFNLINNARAVENIVLSMCISRSAVPDKRAYALELLDRMGIDRETASRTVLKLSGGEQQRVGIARALSHDPRVLVADEPTGNLDSTTEAEILSILQRLAHDEGRCVIVVTHSREVTAIADVVFRIADGLIKAA